MPASPIEAAADALLRVIVKEDRSRFAAKLAASKGRPAIDLGPPGATDGLDVAGLVADPIGTACRAELRRVGHVLYAVHPDEDFVALQVEIAEMDPTHADWRAMALEAAWSGIGKRALTAPPALTDQASAPGAGGCHAADDEEAPSIRAYSFAEAARMIGVSRSTVYAVVADGRLTARRLGGKRLIRRSDLETFLDSLPVGGGSPERTTS